MSFSLAITHNCCIGALYGYSAGAPENSIFARLLLLLDVARLTTQCEREYGVVSVDQQNQRVALEFLVHLVGTGAVTLTEMGGADLHHRMHRHMQALGRRLRAVGYRFEALGGDVAYLRAVWTEDNIFAGAQRHALFHWQAPAEVHGCPLAQTAIANGMSIFQYIASLQAAHGVDDQDLHSAAFLRQLWTDIVRVYAPLVGVAVDNMAGEWPRTMTDLLLQYFELAKRPGVVAALTEAVIKDVVLSAAAGKVNR
ncbi:hypothetical protein SPBR_01992 [Sporothrix brasiliensis 5110]|uniref:Uncharacterized protein n=1 Tax=Sporothrix brasiliensis 5110 TaxID=1398154 RepID=A0A0C2FJD4_9PEZI|nr:uncharacterized protein SPBR_01992 [Sporothrix brasiliensis 5110]KIH91128.1 hypothetical protein SPBR_01992 [Sporothrix brasiliensis 5110]